MKPERYIPVKQSFLKYYTAYNLYYRTTDNNYLLYKPAGKPAAGEKANARLIRLYIDTKDRLSSLKQLQSHFYDHIDNAISANNVIEVKSTLCNLVEETLAEPRSGSLKVLPETVDVLVSRFSDQPSILKAIASMASKDYSTIVHSVNVMALVMGYCYHSNLPMKMIKQYSLSALLHDIGKIHIPSDILQAPRRLSEQEFTIVKQHTQVGADLIKSVSDIDEMAARVALEHHEKLDGSGYPFGNKKIAGLSNLIGFIDAYEALTNDDRPYRRAQNPFETLKILKKEVDAGKYDKAIFEKFCRSLK